MKNLIFVLGLVLTLCGCSSKDEPTPTEPPVAITIVTGFLPKTGSAGTVVTINGSNFGNNVNNVSVKFGTSAEVKPQTVEVNKIVAIVPPDATNGRITVIINSLSYYSSETFTYTVSGTPL